MDKKEILKKLEQSGEVHKKDKTDLWKAAFELYKPSTGDYHVSMDCGACFAAVLKWLRQ